MNGLPPLKVNIQIGGYLSTRIKVSDTPGS
jgi:hypothetical protein